MTKTDNRKKRNRNFGGEMKKVLLMMIIPVMGLLLKPLSKQ